MDHLEFFSKMKASEVKEMLKAYNSSLNEDEHEDDEEEEHDEDESPKKQDESVEKAVKEIDVTEDVEVL